MRWHQSLLCVLVMCLVSLGLAGCRSLRHDLRDKLEQAMSEEPQNSRADSQWTTHSTSTQAVPSAGSRHTGDFGGYSQPTTGERRYHSSRPE